MNLTGPDHIGIGCDFDGADNFTEGVRDVSDMVKLYNILDVKYGAETADKIFSRNFERVVCAAL
jgi:membrane dipeptidase